MTDQPIACPYLGLPDDPRTRFSVAMPAHRCYVNRKSSPIDLGHQGVYCLSSDFPACKRFRAPAAAIGAKAESARTAGPAVVTAIQGVPSPVAPAPVPVAPAPVPVAPPSAAAHATDDRSLSVAPEAVPSWPSVASPSAAPWADTALPETAPAVRPRKRPWFAEATPIADTRARLPQTAPLAARERARSRSALQRSGGKRNVRRGALLVLILLAVAALAAAAATGSLARLLPAPPPPVRGRRGPITASPAASAPAHQTKVPWDAVTYLGATPTEQLTLQTSTSYHPTSPRFIAIAYPTP